MEFSLCGTWTQTYNGPLSTSLCQHHSSCCLLSPWHKQSLRAGSSLHGAKVEVGRAVLKPHHWVLWWPSHFMSSDRPIYALPWIYGHRVILHRELNWGPLKHQQSAHKGCSLSSFWLVGVLLGCLTPVNLTPWGGMQLGTSTSQFA